MDRHRYFVHGVSCRLGETSLSVVNLSPGGLFASTNQPPPPGQHVEVELNLPPRRIRMGGRVRWTNDDPAPGDALPCGFGLQIVRIAPEGERAIRDLLKGSNPLEGPPASW